MISFIQPFINLLLFRAGPQDMPASQSTLKLVLISCFIADMLGAVKSVDMSLSVLVLTAIKVILLGGFIYILLNLFKKPERWLQTLSAVYGAQTLIHLASLPFMHKIQLLENGQLIISDKMLIVAALQMWLFVVIASILKGALEIKMARALIINLVLNVLLVFVLVLFSQTFGLESGAPRPISIEAQ